MTILSTILAFIFFTLAGFHVYWLLGGKWGLESTIPEAFKKMAQKQKHAVPLFATFVVAISLYAITFLFLMNVFSDLQLISANFHRWLTLLVSVIFLLRAVGDFRILGFFKSQKEGQFAYADTFLFSPLCLVICIGSAVVFYNL